MGLDLRRLLAKARNVVVAYSEDYAVSHTAFASRMWKKRRRREPLYQRWKFRGPAQGPVPGLLLAVVNGEVVGQTGLIPVTARIQGEEHRAQWVCDLMVDDKVRGTGYGALLLAAAMDRGYVTLGSNPSTLAGRLLKSMGFDRMKGPVHMLLPVNPRHLLSWRLTGRFSKLLPLASALVRPVVAIRNRKLWCNKSGGDFEFSAWQQIQDRIRQSEALLHEAHIVHDADFLSWRCHGLEGFSLPFVGIQTPGGAWALVSNAKPYCSVADWMAPDDAECLNLARGIYAYAASNSLDTIKMLANKPEERAWLSNLGFLSQRHPTSIVIHSSHSRPQEGGVFRYCQYDSDENL